MARPGKAEGASSAEAASSTAEGVAVTVGAGPLPRSQAYGSSTQFSSSVLRLSCAAVPTKRHAAADVDATLRDLLLAWFDQRKRQLPWRDTNDVYRIWISEVMLQQTRVDTVLPYYQRFVARFPTVKALAEASSDEVLSNWSGLGYYRRARNLQLAAKEVVENHAGIFPNTVKGLEALPGIGEYTARAVASIGYGVHVAVVDGNVARVVARWKALEEPIDKASTKRTLAALATQLCDARRPGDSNQAMMELGATVCTPSSPKCDQCPLRGDCAAFANQRMTDFPKVESATKVRAQPMAALVIKEGNRVLLMRRPNTGLFAGLWEPPMGEGELGELVARLTAIGIKLEGIELLQPTIKHVLSHRVLTVTVATATAANKTEDPLPPYEAARWFDPERMQEVGVSRLAHLVLTACAGGSPKPKPKAKRGTSKRKGVIPPKADAANRK
jgi:A/G-specific adenine glycosylase